jgi:hypothetical protein
MSAGLVCRKPAAVVKPTSSCLTRAFLLAPLSPPAALGEYSRRRVPYFVADLQEGCEFRTSGRTQLHQWITGRAEVAHSSLGQKGRESERRNRRWWRRFLAGLYF